MAGDKLTEDELTAIRAQIQQWRDSDHRYEWKGHVTVYTATARAEANEHWRQVEREMKDGNSPNRNRNSGPCVISRATPNRQADCRPLRLVNQRRK